jgi:F-type H+-transporting ATPase subunit delta
MDTTLAKRYAKALLDLGEEDGDYLKYGEELKSFSEAVEAAGPEVKTLDSPVYPLELRRRILHAILEKASLSRVTDSFARLLFDRGRFSILKEISDCYGGFLDEKEGIVRGVLYSVSPLDQRDFSAIREALSIYAGKKAELEQRIDPSLIGGVVARLGDLVLDGSVKTRLDKLAAIFSGD